MAARATDVRSMVGSGSRHWRAALGTKPAAAFVAGIMPAGVAVKGSLAQLQPVDRLHRIGGEQEIADRCNLFRAPADFDEMVGPCSRASRIEDQHDRPAIHRTERESPVRYLRIAGEIDVDLA